MSRKRAELNNVPDYRDLINPTFLAIKNSGGTAGNYDIHDEVVAIMHLSEETVNIPHTGKNESELIYRLRWARTWMKKAGIIINKSRGKWVIQQAYLNVDELSSDDIDRVLATRQSKSIEIKVTLEDVIDSNPDSEPWYDELRNELVRMDSYGFEKLCKIILEQCGITDVIVTKKTRDHGIDGIGRLNLNEIFSVKVVFQCKRYKYDHPINSSDIQQFRGATLSHQDAEMGLFITTSRFTKDAINEAKYAGIKEIHLMDIDDIINKLLEHEIGVKRETVYLVDKDFFGNLK